MSVALARRTGTRCRFARSGGLGPPTRCTHRRYLAARGTASWRFRFGHRLPRGSYSAWVRAVDAAGNASHAATRLRVR